jgi:uncharacterized pyridoxamine 5'-phosphate oxidase family protein
MMIRILQELVLLIKEKIYFVFKFGKKIFKSLKILFSLGNNKCKIYFQKIKWSSKLNFKVKYR